MTSKNNYRIKLFLSAFTLAGVIVAMGFGCGVGFEPVGLDSLPSLGLGINENGGDFQDNGNLAIVPGQKTIGISRYGQVLRNMESQTGVKAANNQTITTYLNKATSFSQTGLTNTVTSPYLLSLVALGGAICDQFVGEESAQPAANRRVFVSFGDFGNDAAPSDTELADVISRQSRNFWGREPSSEEITDLLAGVNESINAEANNNNLKENAALYLCTSMIASTNAYSN